jgi:PAS domain S-box-containing protein
MRKEIILTHIPTQRWPAVRKLIAILALAGVYFCAGKLGLSWAHVHVSVSAVWPPSGLALAALLLWGWRLWPGVFLGAFLLNITTQGTVATTLGIAAGNTLEALAAAWAIDRFANGAKAFERARNILKFVLLGPILSTVVSATFGVTSLSLAGFAQWNRYGAIWLTWWLGDAVGDLIFTPLVVIWVTLPHPQWKPKRVAEAAGLLISLTAIGYLIFLRGIPSSPDYVVMLPLLWAAFRFGQRGAVTSALIMSGIALAGTLYGVGPYGYADPNESLLRLQSFMGTVAIAALVLAAASSEGRRAEQRLEVQESISRVLAESPGIKDAAARIVQVLCERAGWDMGAIWNVDRAADGLRCVEVWHLPHMLAPKFEAITKEFRFTRGVGLPGRVWGSGAATWITDVSLDGNFPRAPTAIEEGLHSAFGFPIKLGNEVLGVIECLSREVREPDDHFLQMVNDIGGQLGQFMERKRAEDALRAQRLRLRAVTDITPIRLTQCSRDLKYTFVNRAYAAMFDGTPDQIIGKSIVEIMGTEAFETIRPHVESVLQGQTVEYETEIPYPQAGRRFVRAVYMPDKDEQGEVRGWVASISDITERKQAEAEIAALNKQLATDLAAMTRLQQLSTQLVQTHEFGSLMGDILDVAVEIAGADMGNVQLFERATGALKIVAQRGFNAPFLEFFDTVDDAKSACGEAMQRGERVIVENVAASPIFAGTPAGEVMLAAGARAVQSTPLVSRSGRLVGMFSTHYCNSYHLTERQLALLDLLARQAADFIERTQTEDLLLHNEERLRAVVDTAVDGIVTINERGIIDTVNPAAERIFGYRAADMVGRNVRMLMPESYESAHASYIDNYLRTGVKKIIGIGREVEGKRKDGTIFPLDLAVSETRLGHRRIFIGIVRDITERRRAEELLRQASADLIKANEELERRVEERTADLEQAHANLLRTMADQKALEEQLRQAQKMESIGTLAGGIAHDFNNILNIIRGYATLMAQQPLAEDQVRESLKVIDQQIDRGASVVRQLLTVARKTETLLAPTPVNDIVLMLSELIKTFPKTIDVKLDLERRPALVLADQNKLSQALLNICLNARDAMPTGGRLTLRTQRIDGDGEEAGQSGSVCIAISDTGIGMTEEVRRRIFEPFFTTKGIGEGTGLGLAIVYGIVKEHNGSIEVASAAGGGTTFRINLPLHQSEREADAPARKPNSVAVDGRVNHRATVLVVEDEEPLVRLLKKLLPQKGYRVLAAMDGEEGLNLYGRHQAEIDIVLLDLGLPKITGLDVIPKLKEQNPRVSIVITTGYLEPELKAELFRAGVKDCIHKPYLVNEVVEKLGSVIEGY